MNLSTKRAVLLVAAFALSAPARGGAGAPVPLAPCIDLVMVGHLKSAGEPQPMNLPDDIIGHSLYRYDFNPARTLFGRRTTTPMRLARGGHALADVDRGNVVVFLRRWRGGHIFQAYEQAVPDLAGRLFIPVYYLPTPPDRSLSWIPDGYQGIAREIPYSDAAMVAAGYEELLGSADDPSDRYVETREGRRIVRAGVYVDDLAALFARQRRGRCRR